MLDLFQISHQNLHKEICCILERGGGLFKPELSLPSYLSINLKLIQLPCQLLQYM